MVVTGWTKQQSFARYGVAGPWLFYWGHSAQARIKTIASGANAPHPRALFLCGGALDVVRLFGGLLQERRRDRLRVVDGAHDLQMKTTSWGLG